MLIFKVAYGTIFTDRDQSCSRSKLFVLKQMENASKEKQDYCRMSGVLHGGAWGLLHKCDIMSTCVTNAGNKY